MRAVWLNNGGALRGSPVAKYCEMCRIADEKLQEEHREAMLEVEWWQERVAARSNAVSAAATRLAKVLAARYGDLGAITRSALVRAAGLDGLELHQADAAAATAGLAVVDAVELPGNPPFAQYKTFADRLDAAQDPSVVHLVHPDAGSYRLLSRSGPVVGQTLDLSEQTVSARSKDADTRPNTPLWNARREALNLLRSAVRSGADLRAVALYHLAQKAGPDAAVGPEQARDRLVDLGLDPQEAVVLALSLADQLASGPSRDGAKQVLDLLSAGRLREAKRIAQSLPATGNGKETVERLKEATVQAEGLVARVRERVAATDEAGAATAVRELAAVSVEDADELLATVPLLPPRDLRLAVDDGAVRLHWQPDVGHDDNTQYVVCRGAGTAPSTPAHGTRVGQDGATSSLDADAPAGRELAYSVFAMRHGRPSSRPATGSVLVLPPVRDLRADVGTNYVVAHWSVDPGAIEVRAVRHDPGTAPVQLPVRVNATRLDGLSEGETVHVEVTAVYRGVDGRELRAPAATLNATPQPEAMPLTTLRARAIVRGDRPRVQLVWQATGRSQVRFRYAATAPRWAVGAVVTVDELTRFGADVAGTIETARGESRLEADLPMGIHHVVPFSTGGTGIVVGRPTTVGLTEPVRDLTLTVFADYLRAAWRWPASAAAAEVVVVSEDESDLVKCTRAGYDNDGGVFLPLGTGLTEVTVRPLVLVEGKPHAGPPVSRSVDGGGGTEIRYQVVSSPSLGRWGGRSKRVTFRAQRDCAGVRVVMVASPGAVKPLSVDDGVTILDRRLDLRAGVPHTERVTVPDSIRRPYWVLCFVTAGGARLVEPPIASLKES